MGLTANFLARLRLRNGVHVFVPPLVFVLTFLGTSPRKLTCVMSYYHFTGIIVATRVAEQKRYCLQTALHKHVPLVAWVPVGYVPLEAQSAQISFKFEHNN